MIKLFRNIRQNLLNEGKTTKYFKYAIGEIILVVIGILIALQINNWNEDRKLQNKTSNYLKALNKEVVINIARADFFIEVSKEDIERSANTLKLLNIPRAKSYSDSVLREVISTRPTSDAIFAESTLNDLLNSGILEHFENENLKSNILVLETYLENSKILSNSVNETWKDFQLPYLLKYQNVANIWDSISGIKIHKLPFKNNKKAFVYNNEYANILASRMNALSNRLNLLQEIKNHYALLSNSINEHNKND